MPSTSDYLTQLQTDKTNLVSNLNTMGVEASNSETFTSLAPKVLDIQGSGGGTTPTIGYIVDNFDNNGYPLKITTYGYTQIPSSLFYNGSGNRGLKNLNNVILNEGITELLDYAFYYCSNLTTINIPESMRRINASTFFACSSLALTDLKNISVIDTSAFSGCTGIKKLCMEKIKNVSGDLATNNAFKGCTGLKQVWIGSQIMSAVFGRYVFSGCTNLEKIYIDLPRTTIERFSGYQYAFMNDTTKTGIIICNDDEGFITKEQFNALVIE